MFDFDRLSESLKIAILNRLSTEAKARIMCFSDCNRILEAYMAPVQETMRDPEVQRTDTPDSLASPLFGGVYDRRRDCLYGPGPSEID